MLRMLMLCLVVLCVSNVCIADEFDCLGCYKFTQQSESCTDHSMEPDCSGPCTDGTCDNNANMIEYSDNGDAPATFDGWTDAGWDFGYSASDCFICYTSTDCDCQMVEGQSVCVADPTFTFSDENPILDINTVCGGINP